MGTRIAYVIGELGKGGAEYQLVELLRGLDRVRWEPHVVALSAGGYWADEIRRLGVPLVELPSAGSFDWRRLRALRAALRRLAPAVLHTVLWSANCYGRLAAIGLGIGRVVTAERNVVARPAWERVIERVLDPMTDAYLVNARAVEAELVRHGLARSKIHVVHNGIDVAALPPFTLERQGARAALGFPPERRLLAQVGRLAPQKDHGTFLRAMAAVARRHDDVDALVVGDGAERARLQDLAASLGLNGRVRWLGLRDDVPRLLAAADVMTLTSRYEGLPNVVLEAMAMGAAVVATDVGGCAELVEDGVDGRLVAPGDAAAVACAVEELLGSEPRRRAFVEAARARVLAEFSREAMVRRTCDLYAAPAGGA